MKRAEDSDIMIYSIGMEGVSPLQQGGAGLRRTRDHAQRRNELTMQKPDEGMAKIAAATGGGYFELTRAAISPASSIASSMNCTTSTRSASRRKSSTASCTT